MKPVNTYVIADLHFGHEAIGDFRDFASREDHDACISDLWQMRVTKDTDKVWVLGDAVFTFEGLLALKRLRGRKFLVRGNNDLLPTRAYFTAFEEIYGLVKYKKRGYVHTWLSHAPIHPDELRGCTNIHGHVHRKPVLTDHWAPGEDHALVPDPRYVNVCPEAIGYAPVLLRELLMRKIEIDR